MSRGLKKDLKTFVERDVSASVVPLNSTFVRRRKD